MGVCGSAKINEEEKKSNKDSNNIIKMDQSKDIKASENNSNILKNKNNEKQSDKQSDKKSDIVLNNNNNINNQENSININKIYKTDSEQKKEENKIDNNNNQSDNKIPDNISNSVNIIIHNNKDDKNSQNNQSNQNNNNTNNNNILLNNNTQRNIQINNNPDNKIFLKETSQLQTTTFNFLNSNYNQEGEQLIISFGDTFDVFDSFFNKIYYEHNLQQNEPVLFSDIFFQYDDEHNVYHPRGLAINIPNNQYDVYVNSNIIDTYLKDNFIFKENSNQDSNNNKMKSSSRTNFFMYDDREVTVNNLNNNEDKFEFSKNFYNDHLANAIANLIRKEAEKCNRLHAFNFIGDIYSGESVGLLCSVLFELQNDYKNTFKIAHLKYIDSYTHKTFSKIKNYIFTISNLYDHCNLINFFNSNRYGDILTAFTCERLEKKFSINNIISSLLINPKANFIYSNGTEIYDTQITDYFFDFLVEDCREGRAHQFINPQISSLTIYKGNKLNVEQKIQLSDKIAHIVDMKLQNNRSFYNFWDINRNFEYDFITNFHQSKYFQNFTEEFLIDFLQNYNIDNFSKDEKAVREDTIYKVNDIINKYKEIWRIVK